VLAELAAANAAFAVIKQAVSNSGDLLKAGKAISDFVNAKDELQRRGNKKKNSIFGNPAKSNDLEEFKALEAIREKEEELKTYMIYCGRPGLWNDWIRFQGEARVRRQEEAKALAKRREELIEMGAIGLVVLLITIGFAAFIWFVITLKGN